MNNIIKGAREQISLIKISHSLTCFAIPTPHSVPVHVPGLHPSGPQAAGREGVLVERFRGQGYMCILYSLLNLPPFHLKNKSVELNPRCGKIQPGKGKRNQILVWEKPPTGTQDRHEAGPMTSRHPPWGSTSQESRDPPYKTLLWGFCQTHTFHDAGSCPAGGNPGTGPHIPLLLPEPCLASLAGDLCPSLPSRPDGSLPGWQQSQWYSSQLCLNLLL